MFANIRRIRNGHIAIIFLLFFIILALPACGDSDESDNSQEGQLYTCGMHPQVIQDKPGNCPICGMKLTPMKSDAEMAEEGEHEHAVAIDSGESKALDKTRNGKEKRILYWRAPMDPTYISDEPGKSPMGMDLIPVYEGENVGTSSSIKIGPMTVQNMGIRTATVKREPFSRVIRTVGHFDYDEQSLYVINTKFSGWIEKLYVDRTGDIVKKGQPLFEIYSPELVTTQEEYLLAYRNQQKLSSSEFPEIGEGAQNLLQATKQRLRFWDITDSQISKLEKTGEVKKNLTIYSPADGVVVHKNAVEGSRVMSGMDLFRIADLSTVWVYAHIFEYELPWLKIGQSTEMELPYIPGKRFIGKVDYIYPYLDQKSRDVKIRLVFHNPDRELKPQMYANVTIESSTGKHELVIPSEAIIRSGKRNLVFIDLGDGKFRPQNVVIGEEGDGAMVRVIAGLQEGDQIVTSAQFLLDSESRLREAIQKMLQSRKAGSGPDEDSGAKEPEMQQNQGHEMRN
jgi:Cu(I)/Ag(I) efflux system membrane fusion protein/cobalt-zinc-cadmium efflux system membrane fusion protein